MSFTLSFSLKQENSLSISVWLIAHGWLGGRRQEYLFMGWCVNIFFSTVLLNMTCLLASGQQCSRFNFQYGKKVVFFFCCNQQVFQDVFIQCLKKYLNVQIIKKRYLKCKYKVFFKNARHSKVLCTWKILFSKRKYIYLNAKHSKILCIWKKIFI